MKNDFYYLSKLMSNDYSFGQDIHACTHNHNENVKQIRQYLKNIYLLHQVLLIYKHKHHIADSEFQPFSFTDPHSCPFNMIDFEKLREQDDPDTLSRMHKECTKSNDYSQALWDYWQGLFRLITRLEQTYNFEPLGVWGRVYPFIQDNISYIDDPEYQTVLDVEDDS